MERAPIPCLFSSFGFHYNSLLRDLENVLNNPVIISFHPFSRACCLGHWQLIVDAFYPTLDQMFLILNYFHNLGVGVRVRACH